MVVTALYLNLDQLYINEIEWNKTKHNKAEQRFDSIIQKIYDGIK